MATRRGVAVTERANAVVTAMTWSAFGDVVYVVIDREIFVVGLDGKSVAAVAVAECRAAPSYHPTTLTDWMNAVASIALRRCVRAMAKYLETGDADCLRAFSLANVLLDANEEPKKASAAKMSAPAPTAVRIRHVRVRVLRRRRAGDADAGDVRVRRGRDRNGDLILGVRGAEARRDAEEDAFSSVEAEAVAELVSARADRLRLAPSERVELLGVVDALRRVDEHGLPSTDLDDAGRRVAASFVVGHSRPRRADVGDAARGRDACWATLSDTKTELLRHLLGGAATGVDWATIKRLGAPLWMDDDDQLRELIEKCAKGEFAKREERRRLRFTFRRRRSRQRSRRFVQGDAKQASVRVYVSRFHGDSTSRGGVEECVRVALEHRYVFAAAFFILGGRPLDAASIVWKRERDVHLTLVIARLATGRREGASVLDQSSPRGHLSDHAIAALERDVVPTTTDAWTLAAAHWITGRRDAFLDCVITLMDDARDVGRGRSLDAHHRTPRRRRFWVDVPSREKRSVARRRVWRIRCARSARRWSRSNASRRRRRGRAPSAWRDSPSPRSQAMPTTIPSMRSLEIRGPWTSTPFERLSREERARRDV